MCITNHVLLWHIYSPADIAKHMRRQWTHFCSFPRPFLCHHYKFRVSDLGVLVGFKVAVISRDSSRLERLRLLVSPTTKDNLTTVVGNVGKLSCLWNWEQEQPLTLQTTKKPHNMTILWCFTNRSRRLGSYSLNIRVRFVLKNVRLNFSPAVKRAGSDSTLAGVTGVRISFRQKRKWTLLVC